MLVYLCIYMFIFMCIYICIYIYMCLSTMKYLLRLCSKVTGKCICASCYKFIVSIKYKDISYNFLRIHIQFRKGICLELERQLVTSQRSTTRKEGGKKIFLSKMWNYHPKLEFLRAVWLTKHFVIFLTWFKTKQRHKRRKKSV